MTKNRLYGVGEVEDKGVSKELKAECHLSKSRESPCTQSTIKVEKPITQQETCW